MLTVHDFTFNKLLVELLILKYTTNIIYLQLKQVKLRMVHKTLFKKLNILIKVQ